MPSTIAATATAAPSEAGLASGLVNTSRQMGGALGLAILASLAVLYTGHLVNVDYRAPILAFTDGFRLAFLIGAGFAATGAVVAFRLIPKSVGPPGPAPAPARVPAPAPVPVSAPAPAATRAPAASAAGDAPRLAEVPTAPPVSPSPDRHSGTPAPAGRAHRDPRRGARELPIGPYASVVLSVSGGGRWSLAGGSMTVGLLSDPGAGRAS